MPHLAELGVDRVIIHQSWMTAPIGRLLQFAFGSPAIPTVGLRCNVTSANIYGLLMLEGPSIGRLFSPNELGPGAAIDVSDHLDIVLIDAVPVKPTQERGKIHWWPGNASGSSVAVPAVLMRAEVENSYGIECFLQLTAAGRGTDHLGNISTILIDGAVALKPKDEKRRQ